MVYYHWTVNLCLLSLLFDINLLETVVPGYFPWVEEGRAIKSDILCPSSCNNVDTENDFRVCCACHSRPKWELSPTSSLTSIPFERLAISGRTRIPTYHLIDNDTFLSFVHRRTSLSELPENLCDFSNNLVVIDVSLNEIKEINHLNCLCRLDTLILSHNKLSSISNTSFHNMSNLRIIDVSHNLIKSLDPGIFHYPTSSIYHADFSFNYLSELDVSNVLFPNATLCTLNFSNSVFGDFTNVFNLMAGENERLGCGEVIFDNSVLSQTHWNSWNTFLDNPTYVWTYYLEGTFTYNNVSIACDCNMGEILSVVSFVEFFKIYKKDELDGYICRSPETMRGIALYNVTADMMDLFICNRSIYCPENCTCFEQPSRLRFVVNCSHQSHSSLPTRLPLTKYPYYLDFSRNQIKYLPTRPYISNVSHLLLGENEILELDSSFVKALHDIQLLTLTHHCLKSLPEDIIGIDATKFIFGNNSIPCNCATEWISRWRIYSKVSSTQNPLFCRNVEFGIKHVEEAPDYLDCSEHLIYYQIPILIALVILVFLSLMSMVFFKEELLVLKSRLVRIRRNSNKTSFKYDVFMSFDENSPETRFFVVRFLRKFLTNEGYSVIIPCINVSVGATREQEIFEMINKTKSVIVVITKNYGRGDENAWNIIEYERALKLYLTNPKNNLILINFDGLRISNTSLPFLKALTRVNGCLHVADRKRSIYKSVKDRCGPPIVRKGNARIRPKVNTRAQSVESVW